MVENHTFVKFDFADFSYTQAAGEGVDRPIKISVSETCVFGSGATWVSTFTKVILQSYVEAR